MNDELPGYARCLSLQHAAYASDMRSMLADLLRNAQSPEAAGPARRQIADIACGDGFFSRLLAEIDKNHHVVGIDSSPSYLAAARQATPPPLADRLTFEERDILAPPRPEDADREFDVVFCAESLESILDHETLFRQMVRLCRPGGIVVITETDDLHDLIGSWPPEVENTLHRLEWDAMDEADREGYAFPRYASARLRAAGLSEVRVRSYTFDRSGPLDGRIRAWLAEYFRGRLAALSGGSEAARDHLRRHLHPEGEEYFADSPHALLTYLQFCMTGRKPV